MGITVPMPPWLRAWQQTWYGQLLVVFLVGYGGALVAEGAFKNGLFEITIPDLKDAFSTYVLVQFAVWVRGHTVGSTAFIQSGPDNGKPNDLVNKVVEAQTLLPDLKAAAANPATDIVQPIDVTKVTDALYDVRNRVGYAVAQANDKLSEAKI